MANILRDFIFYQRIRKHKILYFWIIPTLRCSFRCKICSVWENADKSELNIEVLEKNVLNSVVLNKAAFILEGGEFFLYSRYEDLLSLLKGRDVIIFTNCSFPERVIHACKDFNIHKLLISLDGTPERNRLIREGSNITYIIEVIKKVRNKTEVAINYTISPFNCSSDLKWVLKFVKRYNLKLEINIYNKLDYLSSKFEEEKIYSVETLIKNPFVNHYNKWLDGDIKIPCVNIKYISAVYPNGDIVLCKKKTKKILGNIYENNFDTIWNSKETKKLHMGYNNCNDCWLKCQREFDFYSYYKYGRFLPKYFKKLLYFN